METIEKLTEKQKRRLDDFVKEAIYLTDKENAAIEHQIPLSNVWGIV